MPKINLDNADHIKNIIESLKVAYEDHWKNLNQINTSIKLPLNIKIKNLDNFKILNFENVLDKTDLIYEFSITKFDKEYISISEQIHIHNDLRYEIKKRISILTNSYIVEEKIYI